MVSFSVGGVFISLKELIMSSEVVVTFSENHC